MVYVSYTKLKPNGNHFSEETIYDGLKLVESHKETDSFCFAFSFQGFQVPKQCEVLLE